MFGLEATCTQRPAVMLTLNILTEGRGVEPGYDHLPSLNKQPVMTAIFNSLLPNFSGSSKLTRIRINSTSALPFSLAHRQNCRPYSSILMFLQIVLNYSVSATVPPSSFTFSVPHCQREMKLKYNLKNIQE